MGEFGAGAIASIRVIPGVKGEQEDMAAELMELPLLENNAATWNWPGTAQEAQFDQSRSGSKVRAQREADEGAAVIAERAVEEQEQRQS